MNQNYVPKQFAIVVVLKIEGLGTFSTKGYFKAAPSKMSGNALLQNKMFMF